MISPANAPRRDGRSSGAATAALPAEGSRAAGSAVGSVGPPQACVSKVPAGAPA